MTLIEKLEHFIKGSFKTIWLPNLATYPIVIQDEEPIYTILYVNHSYFNNFDENVININENTKIFQQNNVIFVTNIKDDIVCNRYENVTFHLINENDFVEQLIKLFVTDITEYETTMKEFTDFKEKELIEAIYENMFAVQINNKKRLEEEVEKRRKNIVAYQEQIIQWNREIAGKMNELTMFDAKFMDKLKNEITKIKKHKKVVDLKIKDQRLDIYTTDLYFKEPITNTRYYLGKMIISLPFEMTSRKEIRFTNINNPRKGWWNNGQDITAHPHVTKAGTACFGNLDNAIADLYSRYEYFELYMLMLNFLQICNVVRDGAGRAAGAWDEVDKDGNIIKQGHYDHALFHTYFADLQNHNEHGNTMHDNIMTPFEPVRVEPRARPIPAAIPEDLEEEYENIYENIEERLL